MSGGGTNGPASIMSNYFAEHLSLAPLSTEAPELRPFTRLLAFSVALSMFHAADLRAQEYPEKTIRLISPAAPGGGNDIHDVRMDFDYTEALGAESPEAYERLLQDALLGDGTLFTRRDEVEVAWSIVDSILTAWQGAPPPFSYPQGSWGPYEADEIVAHDGHRWHVPDLVK